MSGLKKRVSVGSECVAVFVIIVCAVMSEALWSFLNVSAVHHRMSVMSESPQSCFRSLGITNVIIVGELCRFDCGDKSSS